MNSTGLTVTHLTVAYGTRLVLHGIDLEIRPGEVLALAGPNGAGKTTLIKAISGALRPVSGAIHVAGVDVLRLSARQRARQMAVVPQARHLPEDFTAWQTVVLGRTAHLGWFGQPTERDRQQVEQAMTRTDTLSLAERRMGMLSGGEQQRVLLARALAQDTPVLLLDEPTTHLDLHYQASLLGLVQSLAHEHGLAVCMTLHDLNLVAFYADRVALLSKGCIQAIGTPNDVLTPTRLMEIYDTPLHVVQHPELRGPVVLPGLGKLPLR